MPLKEKSNIKQYTDKLNDIKLFLKKASTMTLEIGYINDFISTHRIKSKKMIKLINSHDMMLVKIDQYTYIVLSTTHLNLKYDYVHKLTTKKSILSSTLLLKIADQTYLNEMISADPYLIHTENSILILASLPKIHSDFNLKYNNIYSNDLCDIVLVVNNYINLSKN